MWVIITRYREARCLYRVFSTLCVSFYCSHPSPLIFVCWFISVFWGRVLICSPRLKTHGSPASSSGAQGPQAWVTTTSCHLVHQESHLHALLWIISPALERKEVLLLTAWKPGCLSRPGKLFFPRTSSGNRPCCATARRVIIGKAKPVFRVTQWGEGISVCRWLTHWHTSLT